MVAKSDQVVVMNDTLLNNFCVTKQRIVFIDEIRKKEKC